MKLLILGGTGAMGRHLAHYLSQDDNEIFLTSRTPRQNTNNIKYIQGNAKDSSFLSEVLKENYDAIVDFMVYSTSEFESKFSNFLNHTSQYLFLSSSRVYADSQGPIREDSPRLLDTSDDRDFLATDDYPLSKARCENMLFSSRRNNWTIIRPYITYAEKRLQLGVLEKEFWLFRAMLGKKILFSEDIANKITTMTYGGDVARGIKALIGNPNAAKEAFHITCDYHCTWDEILKIYLDVLEKHLSKRPEVYYTKKSTSLKGGKYGVIYDRYYNRVFDNTKIKSIIKTDDFLMPDVGLKKCLESFLANPSFLNFCGGSTEARADLVTGDKLNFARIPGLKQKIKYLLVYLLKYNPY